MRKLNLHSYFLFWVVLLVMTSLFVTGYMWLADNYGNFRQETNYLKQNYLREQKNILKTQVSGIVEFIEYKKGQAEDELKLKLKSRVYEAHAIATNIYDRNIGKRTDAEISKMIVDALRPIRFLNGRGYYFISRLDGLVQMIADRPELEGKNLFDLQDTKGQYVLRDLIAITKNKGEGFYKYTWSKPESEGKGYAKVAFVKHFKPLGWYIGTGEYVDDFDKDIQAEIFKRVAKIRYGQEGYFFVVSYDGVELVNDTQPDIVGKNLWNSTNPVGMKVIQEQIKIAKQKDGGFLQYVWNKPGEKTPSEKLSYLRGVEDWNLLVGTGLYVDELKEIIALKKASLDIGIKQKVAKTFIVLFVLLVFCALVSKYISQRIHLNVTTLVSYFKNVTDLNPTDKKNELDVYFPEFEAVASEARNMVRALKGIEESLRLSEGKYRKLVTHIDSGFALHEIVLDGDGKPIDYIFLDVNRGFENLTGFRREDILGRNVLDVLPNTEQYWIDTFGKVAITGEPTSVEHYSKEAQKWYSVHAYSPEKNIFAVIFDDVTKRKQAEEELVKSLSDKDMLIKEIHHRVKNNLVVVQSLLSLQSREVSDEKSKGYFMETENRVKSMSMIHERLYKEGDLKNIDFAEYVNTLAIQLHKSYCIDASKVKLNMDVKKVMLDVNTVIPCGLIVNELLSNIFKYAFPDDVEGQVFIGLTEAEDKEYTLVIKDNGIGLPEDFKMDSTQSLGMRLVNILTNQIRGKLEIIQDGGVEFRIGFREESFDE